MVSLSLHEAIPGHHLAYSYSLEQEGWPLFRKVVEDRIYSQSPSRFPINTAFVEGWGLYSESLGFDMGLYDDPMDRYLVCKCPQNMVPILCDKVWPPQ